MKPLAIYGAGGLGREIACLIKKINEVSPTWQIVGFFDDGKTINDEVSHFGKVLGGLNELNKYPTDLSAVLCFGNPQLISKVRSKITNPNISFPNIISPDFSISDTETFSIGEGNIITGQCSVTTNISIGNFNLFNGHINMGHDVTIKDYNVFMPGTRVSGEVSIDSCNLFGADSFIKQGLRIGCHVTLSPLSALLTRPKECNTYIGNPAKIFKY